MSTTEFFPTLKWTWALRDSDLPESVKLLGYVHAVNADAYGKTSPTINQLMLATPKRLDTDDSGPVSKSTIVRRRGKLEKLGWLQLVSKGNGPGQWSVYELTFPAAKSVSESVSESVSGDIGESVSEQTHYVSTSSDKDQELENGVSVEVSKERVHLTTTAPLAEAHPPFGSSEQKIAEWYAQQDKANNGNSAVSSLAASTAVRRCAVCDSGEMVYFDGPNKGKLVPSSRLHEHEGVLLHDHCTTAAVSQ